MENKKTLTTFFITLFFVNLLLGQEVVNLKVFPEIKMQKIESFGANFCQANYTNSAWDAVGEENLKQFKPEYVRVALPLKLRDEKYENYKGNKITDNKLVISVMETLKRMKSEFGVKHFVVSVWNVADELIENPEKESQRTIKPEAYDAVLDMLVAFLVKVKNDYGVEVDYFSFNESDGGWQIIFTPEQTIAFIKKAMEHFKAAGLKTRFLLADTAQTLGTVEFATLIMADSTIWKHLGPLCFHSWWSEDIPDREFERVAAFAKAQNRQVWCSELGFDAMAWKIEGMFATWDYGFRFAVISHRMLRYAQVEVSLYWTWQNNYTVMSPDLKTYYPSYYVTKQQVDYLTKGTQIIHSISSDADILPLCGIDEKGNKIIQLINRKKTAVTIDIEGLDCKSADLVSTTEKKLWNIAKNTAKTVKGHTKISLMPESVNTLIMN